MVDFDTNALMLRNEGIKVVGASVDSVEQAAMIATGMQIGYVKVLGELDAATVAEATGAQLGERGEGPFFHATGFLVDPDGNVAESVYASGPIGRFTCSDILKKVRFTKFMAERAAKS